ncbi:hypothetical protein [Schaalia sp. Marseille-Q2122]|uniref:hypothetical protein n=1 Tax=Schaalia sp. Marseille-Q2122 TaxID=2736604 RepID=UPI0015896186|nr:hypothetical protein [Schaalia sp. Marseille-Q2122]
MSTSEFDARVVVTSSTTVADIPALMDAISILRPLTEELEICGSDLNTLAARVGDLINEGEADLFWAYSRSETARSALTAITRELDLFTEHLGTCALSYSAAEGDAAAFAQLRAWLYPSPLSYLEVLTSGGTSLFGPLARLPRRENDPWRQSWRSGRVRDIFPPSFEFAAVSTAIYGGIFATNSGSDPTDSWAMQFHVEDLSRSLMRTSYWLHQDEAPAGQRWGAQATHATPEAAAVAGGALFGWGRLLFGSKKSILLGRPQEDPHAGATPSQKRAAPRTLRIPRSPQARMYNQSLLPGSPGISQFFNTGQGLGVLPEGAFPTTPSGSSSSWDGGNIDLRLGPEESLPQHTIRTVNTPHDPSALIERIEQLAEGQDYGEFEILKHETPGPHGPQRSWSVVIRGTQHWTAEGSNIQDLHTNLNGVAGLESDQTRAIKAAMMDVGISPDEPVELVGHSQGGIIAAQLASDTEVTERYTVAAVLTAGAPTAGYDPNTSVGMLSLENTRDQVTALDGRENANRGNNLTVHFDGDLLDHRTASGDEVFAHDMSVYSEAIKHFESSPTSATQEVSEWMSKREEALSLRPNTHTTSHVYTTRRSPY